MHSEPQISFHAITPPFRSSHGGRIHRSCTGSVYLLRCDLQDEDADSVNDELCARNGLAKQRSSPHRESCGEIESAFLVLNELFLTCDPLASLLNVDRHGLVRFLDHAKQRSPSRKQFVFCAKICESLQGLFFSCSKPESEMFVVITIKKFPSNCPFVISEVCHSVCHDGREVGKIFVS